jgi:uncharacterized repeat protein (TIGR03803 family)
MSRRFSFLPWGFVAALAFTLLTTPRLQAQAADATPDTATSFSFSVLTSFTGGLSPDEGGHVWTDNYPIQANDGNLYGTSYGPGAGVAYKDSLSGQYDLLYVFSTSDAVGGYPLQGLVEGRDGNFYGIAYAYGGDGDGAIFQMTPSGAVNLIHTFAGPPNDGRLANSTLTQASNGNFYGTANKGGANNDGILYQVTSGGTFSLVHSFAGTADGANPDSAPIQGTDGNLYGVTYGGGAHGDGVVYKISPSGGAITVLYNFSGTADGADCYGPLVQGTDGNFYGTCEYGGADGHGSAYKITPAGSFTLLHSFAAGTTDGSEPIAGLVEATDGNFYGMTYLGGASAEGTLFQLTSSGGFSLLHSFAGGASDGLYPQSGLMQASDGNIYGAAYQGGADNFGVIFKMTASPALAAPVQLSAPANVSPGQAFTMSYSVLNSYAGSQPGTLNQCFATNTAGDTTYWTGTINATPTTATKSVTAPASPGTYTYALTCGGQESSTVSISVATPVVNFSSVTHNFGSVSVGASGSAYGVQLTNTSGTGFPFSGVTISGSSEFTQANNCPATVAAGATCEIVFYFAPTAGGSVSAAWSVNTTSTSFAFTPSNGGTLTGSGTASTGTVTLTSAGHNFGTIAVSTQSPTYGTELTNSSGSTITLTKGSVTAPFTALTNCGTTLAAGASCELEFYFTPSTTSTVQQVYTLSATPTAITSGGVALPNGGITLTGN